MDRSHAQACWRRGKLKIYLKSIDLFGFKTFAERMHLDFEPGISAVVGPNGSGKSNLVDAVRWVLGEQSARELRGARMDEVIFAGNHKRRPLGMAEVTLTFDNADGALATPFSEIAVTRRVYRNGEGEYFLNRTQVRLRDVIDLFIGSGLGPESAAIISQGEIDAILAAKPEARREVLEEVAGTSKFRGRKREAQRRFEQTESNALRVNDLLAELDQQVAAIEQQVRRAKRHQKLARRLRDLEILSYLRKTEARRIERAAVAAALQKEDAAAGTLEERRSALQAEASKARYEEYQATLALDERNATCAELAAAMQDLAAAQAAAQARAQEGARRCAVLAREIESAEAALGAELERLERSSGELERARAERDATADETRETDGAAREAAAAWEGSYAALRAVEDRRAAAAAEAAQAESAAAAAARVRESFAAEQQRLQSEWADLDRRTRAAEAMVESLEAELSTVRGDAARAVEALAAAHARRAAADGALEAARVEADARRAAHTETAARLQALAHFEEAGFGVPAGVRAVAAQRAAGGLPGVVGIVSELLEVDAPYATAVDAALGARAHDVVVENAQAAQAAIAALQAERAGRATFLALDLAAEQRAAGLAWAQDAEGLVGRAIDLVRFPAQVRAAVELILGDVLVVDSLAAALRAARVQPGATLVTLQGEVVRKAAISGGSEKTEAGPLSRRWAAQALARDLAQLESDLAATQAAFDSAKAAAAEAAGVLEAAAARNNELLIEQHAAEARLERARADVAALELRRSERAGQMAKLKAAFEASFGDARAHAERTARGRAIAQALEAEREFAAAEVDRLHRELSRLRDVQRDGAARYAALVERVVQIGDEAEAARRAIAARAGELEERRRALSLAAAERDESTEEARALEGRRAHAQEQLAALQSEAEELKGKRDAVLARAQELEESLGAQARHDHERSFERERGRIRLAEIDAELKLLAESFAQNPAPPLQCDEIARAWQSYEGDADADMRRIRDELARLGSVNLNALEDQAKLVERRDFLRAQLADLEQARASILSVIADIDAESVRQFDAVFARLADAFAQSFARLFGGGVAKMWLLESGDPAQAGVEIAAQPPGKRMQSLNALSGGERAMTAVALIFAILRVRPSPFYIFDEIDAALDEANIGRFGQALFEFAGRSQIVIITHNKATMTLADRLYGVTMGEPGVSSILSLALEKVGA